MKKTSLAFGLTAATAFIPLLSYAAPCSGSSNICAVIDLIGNLIDGSIGILSSLALLVFIWGLVKYIWSQGTDGKASGKKIMIGGVVALFVLFSVFGLVYFLRSSFGINNIQNVTPPQVNF